jgi:hypothetical protein
MSKEALDIPDPFSEMPVGCVAGHFLDSGAFTLWTTSAKYATENGCGRWDYYETPEFWAYMKAYVKFVKEHDVSVDLHANVDVIGNPELTWRNQRWLEKKGLVPVPVVHYKTDLRWLRHYMDKGYKLIGLGGLVGSTAEDSCKGWIDRCFDLVCDQPSRLPQVRLHGFGVTSYKLMLRYPWWSVDSTSWTKIGAYGGIMVPHKRRGQFIFDEQPYLIKVSSEAKETKKLGQHYLTLTRAERDIVKEWLDEIGIPLGAINSKGEVTEYGVITRHIERRAANCLYFHRMQQSLPQYPWPFRSTRRKGLGVLG